MYIMRSKSAHPNLALRGWDLHVAMERTRSVANPRVFFSLPDNGGRRSGIDRRKFSYSAHIPERRQGVDRRSGHDRRQLMSGEEGGTWNEASRPWGKMERRIGLKRLPAPPHPY